MSSEPTTTLHKQRISAPTSREIATIGLFGALSIMLTIISNDVLRIMFVPPASYLLFDFGEVPVMICFLALGLRAGLSVAAIEFLALNFINPSPPLIGPSFKLISVVATLFGLWLAWKLPRKFSFNSRFAFGSVIAALVRAAALTVPNAIYLVALGTPAYSQIFYDLLELTAIFNVLQIPFDMIPTYIVIQLPQVNHMLRKNGLTWFEPEISGKIE